MNKKEWLSQALERIDNMTREEFLDSLEKAGFFIEYVNPADIPHKVPEYGALLTREEYDRDGWMYESHFISDGIHYWDKDPEFHNSTHVLCLSK